MSETVRSLKNGLGNHYQVEAGDVKSSDLTNTQLSNAAKAESITLFDSAVSSLTAGAATQNIRLFTLNGDQSWVVSGASLVCGEGNSLTSGANHGITLDNGTSVMAAVNIATLSKGSTTAFSLQTGSVLTLAASANIRARIAKGGGGMKFGRFTKIILHVRHSG